MFERIRRRRAIGQGLVPIREAHTRNILRIVKAGWGQALEKGGVSPKLGEVQLTRDLRKGMIDMVNSGVVRGSKKISVLPGTESWSSTNPDRPSGLTDIPIFLCDVREKYGDHDPHAVIECKRVSGNDADLCGLYVNEGIGRFISGKYGERHGVAFMAGYVVSAKVKAAVSGINKYLSGRGRAQDHLKPGTVFNEAWARSSRHARPNSTTPIDLHHAFLEFPQS